jgi:hypothetical protein
MVACQQHITAKPSLKSCGQHASQLHVIHVKRSCDSQEYFNMPDDIHLGQVQLRHSQSGLNLWSNANMQVKYPSESLSPDSLSQESLPGSSDFFRSLQRSWVTRGNNFTLRLAVTLDGLSPSHRELMQLGEAMIRHHVWSILNLRSKLVLELQDPAFGSPGIIAIGIDHDRDAKPPMPPRNSASQICYGIHPGEISPPSSTPIVLMNGIDLTLSFSTPKLPSEVNSHSRWEQIPLPRSDDDILDSTQETLVEEVPPYAYSAPSSPLIDLWERSSMTTEEQSSQVSLIHTAEDTEVLYTLTDNDSKLDEPQSSEWMNSDDESENSFITEQFESIVSLSKAMLNLIIDSRMPLPKGVTVINDTFKQRLVDIAPVLWKSNYASASCHTTWTNSIC